MIIFLFFFFFRFDECLNGSTLKPVLNSSFTLNSTKSENVDSTAYENNSNCKTANDLNDTVNLESVGISVDSLDNSYFERKCEEVVNKCKTQDKSKYKLTFEQMDDSITESLINYFQNDLHNEQTEEERQQTYERYLQRLKNNEVHLNRLFDDLNRRMQMDKLSKSEHSNNGRLQADEKLNNQPSQLNTLNELNNLTKSLQNNLISNDYMPLFNLNNSFNSDSSPASAPKNLNLIKLFNNNSQNSSLESQSSASNNQRENSSREKGDKNRKTIQANEQLMNQNNLDQTKVNSVEDQYAFRNSNSTSIDNRTNSVGVNKIANNLKIFYNRQASPIREEDERDSTLSRKEAKKYTNFQDMTAKKRNLNSKLEKSLDNDQDDQDDQDDELEEWNDKLNCPRSFSMNDFNNSKRLNLLKQYSLKAMADVQHQSKPTNSRTNRNSRECSLSSGYLSSGGSNNLINNDRKHFQLNHRTIQQQQSNPQQLTVLEDKQVQTSIYDKNKFHQTSSSSSQTHQQPILINELPKNCCQNSTHSNNSPIYCFFPNYSLPDLNFVNDSSISFQNLHLSPTKFQLPNLDFSTDRRPPATSNNINLRFNKTKLSSKIRPKSCGDFEKIAKDAIKHIQDWDSLKTLLPDDIRDLIIGTLNSEEAENDEENDKCFSKITKSKTTSNTPTSNKTFQMAIAGNYLQQSRKSSLDNNRSSTTANTVKLRNLKLNRGFSLDNNPSVNKRFSLQEPLSNLSNECTLDCSSGNAHSEASNCSNQRRGMIKSATMNMPIIIQQQQQLIQQQRQFQMSRMSCHGSCHSCCSINTITQQNMCPHQQQMNMGSCCSSCHCSFSNHLNQVNNNFCNHHCSNHQDYYQQQQLQYQQQQFQQQQFQQQQFKMTSPLKPFNSIIQEQNEENDFESLNCLLENENENGELDFDRLLNCNQEARKSKNRINQNKEKDSKRKTNVDVDVNKSKLNNNNLLNRKDNFNELKSHWEQVTNSTSTPNTSTPTTAKISTFKQIKQQPTKRPISNTTTLRQTRSQVRSKVNTNRRSRSKSPEKSSKEVIILTKKKPEISAKPTINSNTLTKTGSKAPSRINSAQQTSTTAKPVRPSSFNSQFKSMIPRPTTNRSPLIK